MARLVSLRIVSYRAQALTNKHKNYISVGYRYIEKLLFGMRCNIGMNIGTDNSSSIVICDIGYYGVSEASVAFRRLTEISEYERPAGLGHALARLIPQQPLDRLTCGNFCRVASSLLPTTGQ